VESKARQYLRTQVMTASPGRLVVLLYDGAIRFMKKGLEEIRAGKIEASLESINRAERIILELLCSLDPEADKEFCSRLSGLYVYIYQRLVHANIKKTSEPVEEALRLVESLRDAWSEAVAKEGAARSKKKVVA
jgi:flagellar protein FliS